MAQKAVQGHHCARLKAPPLAGYFHAEEVPWRFSVLHTV